MKARKALKRLNRVEVLISKVIDQFPPSARGLRELLDSAKASVVRAKGAVNARLNPAAKESPDRQSTRGRLSAEGRKRISLAAKKRWAAAKRKGMNAVTGRRLRTAA